MSTDSAFNGYGYLSPYADTCFYRDERNGLLKTVTTYLLQLLKPFLKILRLLLLFVTLSMPFY